jgi:hypothetical protein
VQYAKRLGIDITRNIRFSSLAAPPVLLMRAALRSTGPSESRCAISYTGGTRGLLGTSKQGVIISLFLLTPMLYV